MRLMYGWLCIFFLLIGCATKPQKEAFSVDSPRASFINERVRTLGYPKDRSMESITTALLANLQDDYERIYAIYRWVTQNITYDVESYLAGRFLSKKGSSGAFKTGFAVCDEYADLIQDMATIAKLDVVRIEGIAKGFGLTVAAGRSYKANHAWNAVKLDGQWRLLDSTWDAGGVDPSSRKFVRNSGRPAYFLGSPEAFSTTHFPLDAKWQLLKHSVNFKDFAESTELPPDLEYLGFDPIEHKQKLIKSNATPYRFHFGNQVKMVKLGLKRNNVAIEGNWSMLVWNDQERADILLSAPAPGKYNVVVYGSQDIQSPEMTPLLNYDVEFEQAMDLNRGFPLTYAGYYSHKVQLKQPLSGQLLAHHGSRFKFKATKAIKAALFLNNTFLHELPLIDGHFDSEVTLHTGLLQIGVMGAEDQEFQIVLAYRVVPN